MRAALVLALVLGASSVSAQSSAPPAPVSRVIGPSARDVVRMVLKAAQMVDPERVALLVRRARLAGLSPSLRLAAERGVKQDLSSSSTTSAAERLAAAVADNLSFEASLTFDLSRLVFAPEEVRLLSVQRWLSGDQRKLAEEAVQLYFRRRKLLLQERSAASDEAAEVALAIEEIEALLDAMTDGAFLRALARAQPNGRKS